MAAPELRRYLGDEQRVPFAAALDDGEHAGVCAGGAWSRMSEDRLPGGLVRAG